MKHFALIFTVLVFSSCSSVNKLIGGNEKQFHQREFRSITLKNGLDVLLISDANVKKSAAAMSVDVGWLSDPVEHQGLAHFVEHLLFISTEKYPKVGEYMQFIDGHGGVNNAYTYYDITNYMFEIDNKAFPEGLDRFAQFFISPKFEPQYVQREKKAIDNEFSLRKENDWSRFFRIAGLISDPESNFKTFSIGSSKALSQTTAEDARAFFNRYYSSNLMKLAVIGPQSLDDLENLVRPTFAGVRDTKMPKATIKKRAYLATDRARHVELKTIGDRRDLLIMFNAPDINDYKDSKPHVILDYLLSYKGRGSLASKLSDEGLATEVSGWVSGFGRNGVIGAYFNLTPKGLKNVEKVTEEFYKYIALIKAKGYKKYIFDEQSAMGRTELQNRDLQEGFDYIKAIAADMQKSAPLEIFDDRYLIKKYSPEDFQTFLDVIQPTKMTRTLMHKGARTGLKGEHFGMEYSVQNIEDGRVAELAKVSPGSYQYPGPNEFSFSSDEVSLSYEDQNKQPTAIGTEDLIYLHRDADFKNPKATLKIFIRSRQFEKSPQQFAIANLYQRCLAESLREWQSPMESMKLNLKYEVTPAGMEITLAGYVPRMEKSLDHLFSNMKNLNIDSSQFRNIRRTYAMEVANLKFDRATTIASKLRRNLYSSDYYDHELYQDSISSVSLDEVKLFARTAFKEIRVFAAAHGQLTSDQVGKMAQLAYQKLEAKRVETLARPYVFDLKGRDVAISKTGAQSLNSWGMLLIPPKSSEQEKLANHASILIYDKAFNKVMFAELRTKRQLGYAVGLWGGASKDTPVLHFAIHSNNTRPRELEKITRKWFRGTLDPAQLDDAKFTAAKSAVINEIENIPIDRDKRMWDLWSTVFSYGGDFEYKKKLVSVLKEIDKSAVLKRISNLLKNETSTTTVYISAKGTPAEKVAKPYERITNIKAFRSTYKK